MIEDVAREIKKSIAANHRYFFDSKIAHKYSFKVSVLRITLQNEMIDRINFYRANLKDIPPGKMEGVAPPKTAEQRRNEFDAEFKAIGGVDEVVKEAAEDGIRKTFINPRLVEEMIKAAGGVQEELFKEGTPKEKITFKVKKVNANALNIEFAKGEVAKKRGASKSKKGQYQTIVNKAIVDIYREARKFAFDYIETKGVSAAKSRQGQKGPGLRSAGGKKLEKKLVKGHGRAQGLGMEVKPQGKDQTTVAVLALAKDFASMKNRKKFKLTDNYEKDILSKVSYVNEEIFNALNIEYGITRYQDVDTNEFDEDLVIDVHATDHKGNRALRHYDANGIRDYVDKFVKDKLIPSLTAGLSTPKAIQMKGSRSKKELVEYNTRRMLLESLLGIKGTRPDFRLKINRKLLAEAKKAKGQKKATAKTFSGSKQGATTKKAIAAKAGSVKKAKRGGLTTATTARTSESPIALRNLLNEMLPETVAKNMGSPALNYRTGRFANSTRVENVNIGPRGGLHIDYTYMRNPYETFEPGGKQGSVQRDPRRLIGKSIRELAVGILGKQPTTIRRN